MAALKMTDLKLDDMKMMDQMDDWTNNNNNNTVRISIQTQGFSLMVR